MKLLRLTTDNKQGIFDSSLDQELTIAPNSQIALGSASLELRDTPLVLTSANNKIKFQVTNANPHITRLDQATYNSSNSAEFFTDFQNKLNAGLGNISQTAAGGVEIVSASEIGRQYQIEKETGQQIKISCNQSPSTPFREDDLAKHVAKKPLNGGVSTDLVKLSIGASKDLTSGSETSFNNNDFFCSYANVHPITKGCGVHSARIKTLQNNDSPADPDANGGSGFSLSLHNLQEPTATTPPYVGTGNPMDYLDRRNMNTEDIKYGIKCASVIASGTTTQTGNYEYIINGRVKIPGSDDLNPVVPITSGGPATEKDVVALEIVSQGGLKFVRGVVYKNNAGTSPLTSVLFSEPYGGEDLWASYTFHGAGFRNNQYGCRLDRVKYTADPYQEASSLQAIGIEDLNGTTDVGLGASSPIGQNKGQSQHIIEFDGTDIPKWLGFNPPTQTLSLLGSTPINFIGQDAFVSKIENDCFLLEMLNIPIDSYDYEPSKKKRMNLLSVFPFDDSLGKCSYDPNNLIFLDLRNKEPLRLRDIRCRLLRSDYTEADLTGMSSIVIYVKDGGEKSP